MRGRGTDIDADARQHDLILELHAAADIGKEYPAALFVLVVRHAQTTVDFFAVVSAGFSYHSGFMRMSTPFFFKSASYSWRICGSSIQ